MSSFDKVIGYINNKSELLRVCDMIKNPEAYSKLGAVLPQGVLLEGEPGMGKTLMAKSFIEECGVPAYTVRKTKSSGDFIETINAAFGKAKACSPAIVFLDDMDKFANEDKFHRDAEEYVAIQACIDEVKGKNVFVIATVNDADKLPDSLRRAGRFDLILHFSRPDIEEATEIIRYYLSEKKVAPDINMEDISKMFSYSSCAALESVINCAAIIAAADRKEEIEMEDLVKAILKEEYGIKDSFKKIQDEERELHALHEAGHAVVCELVKPGSVGLISIKGLGNHRIGGFVHRCVELDRRPHEVWTCLGGKAATEMYYADRVASGCQSDLGRAFDLISDGISESATKGLSFYFGGRYNPDDFDEMKYRLSIAVQAEMESSLLKTRDLLLKNRAFLEAIRDELIEKETLLASDIQRIKSECEITELAA